MVALSAATLVALPGVAEAQETGGTSIGTTQYANRNVETSTTPAQPAFEPATRWVVSPGDSLWSIGQARLGPGAAPQQIHGEVERIFELNRDLIGEDADWIFPGQELLLPPAVAEHTGATAPMTEYPAAVARPAAIERAPAATQDEEPVTLPDLPEAETNLVAATVKKPPPEEPANDDERWMLGLGILLLTIAIAALMVWKLPMKRN